jgi:hypothetical protein
MDGNDLRWVPRTGPPSLNVFVERKVFCCVVCVRRVVTVVGIAGWQLSWLDFCIDCCVIVCNTSTDTGSRR